MTLRSTDIFRSMLAALQENFGMGDLTEMFGHTERAFETEIEAGLIKHRRL